MYWLSCSLFAVCALCWCLYGLCVFFVSVCVCLFCFVFKGDDWDVALIVLLFGYVFVYVSCLGGMLTCQFTEDANSKNIRPFHVPPNENTAVENKLLFLFMCCAFVCFYVFLFV